MKINHYAVIPAQVRYDRALSDKSILLFGEIVAASNAYGVCEEDNGYFAAALRVDPRTITRCVGQLIEQGHLQRFKEENRRKFKIITRGLELPDGVEIEVEVVKPLEDLTSYLDTLFQLWDTGLKTIFNEKVITEKREVYENIIRQRLETFTKEELLSSIKNRINFMSGSDWFKAVENRAMACSIEPVIKNDEAVLRWLNAKAAAPEEQILHSIKKDKFPAL